MKKYLYLLIKIVHKIKWNDIISVSISMAAKVTVQADEDMFNIETGATLTRYDISIDIQNVLQQGNFPVDQLCPKKVAWSASIVLSDA